MEVRIFTTRGEHLHTVGRKGSGPGEFRQITSLSRLGPDSVVVWDAFLQRATVLSNKGVVGRLARLSPPGSVPDSSSASPPTTVDLRPVVATDDGGWLSVGPTNTPPPLHPTADGASVRQASSGRPHGAMRYHVGLSDSGVAVGSSDDFRIEVYQSNGELLHVVSTRLGASLY